MSKKISPDLEADIRLDTSQFQIYAKRLLENGVRPDMLISLISFLAYDMGISTDQSGFNDKIKEVKE